MSTSRRQDAYKNKGQFKADELRRRREEAQVEIRKQKREESMAKRRNLDAAAVSDAETDDEEAVGAILDRDVSSNRDEAGGATGRWRGRKSRRR